MGRCGVKCQPTRGPRWRSPPAQPPRSAFFSRFHNTTPKTLAFRGHFEHTLDAKNRLTVPATFRTALAGGIVIAQSLEPCAAIWTPEAFEAFTDSFLSDLNPLSDEARRMSRFFHGGSFDTEIDKAGRVMIPARLIEKVGLGKDLVIVGNDDHLELWDSEAWASYETDLDATVIQTVEKIVNPS